MCELQKANKAKTRPFPDCGSKSVYELSVIRWQTQQQQIDSIDTKIGNILGFGGALVAILLGILAILGKPAYCQVSLLFCISGIAYILIVIISLISYFAIKWKAGPDLTEVWKISREYSEDKLVWWAAESFTKSYEDNDSKLQLKAIAIRTNIVLFGIQSAAIVSGIFLIVQ